MVRLVDVFFGFLIVSGGVEAVFMQASVFSKWVLVLQASPKLPT